MINKLTAVFALFFLFSPPALADKAPEAEAFVKNVSDRVIVILGMETAEEKELAFGRLLREQANLRRIGAFTLGSYRRQLSPEQLEEFQALFETMLTKIYANRLGSYDNQQLVILSSARKKKDFLVESELRFETDNDPVPIVWRMRQEKDGRLTLFDLRVLGIWMALEQRETFLSILRNNNEDFNALLDSLRQQIAAGADPETGRAN